MKFPGKTLAKATLIGPELLVGSALVGVAIGAAIGAGIGILLAPAKGSDTRQKIADTGNGYVDNVKDTFTNFVEDIKDKFSSKTEELAGVAEGITGNDGTAPLGSKSNPKKVHHTGHHN